MLTQLPFQPIIALYPDELISMFVGVYVRDNLLRFTLYHIALLLCGLHVALAGTSVQRTFVMYGLVRFFHI